MSRPARNGLSLIEVLVGIGIVAIVIGLLIPANRRVGVSASRMHCQNNLKQIMLGMHNFAGNSAPSSSTGGSNSPAELFLPTGCSGPGSTPQDRLSWMVTLLPYMEQNTLYQRFDIQKGYAENHAAAHERLKVFLCPEGKKTGDSVTHYVAMAGIGHDAAEKPEGNASNGFMGYDRRTSFWMITDGTSNTIALLETHSNLGPWARGGSSNLRGFDSADVQLQGNQRSFGRHTDIMTAAMADGSVRSIQSSIDPKSVAAAITIAGGEPFDLD